MRTTINIDPADADADGLGAANSSAGATYTLDGVLTSSGTFTSADGLAHRISITDAGASNQTTATYTVTGTDVFGNTVSEAITGPASTATVESTEYFYTVTSVTIANPVGGSTADMGTVDEIAYQPIPLNWRSEYGANVSVNVTGTLNFTVQETYVDIQRQTPFWVDVTALASKTVDATSSTTVAATAYRFILNSYSSGAEAQVYITQPDNC
jgi:hypothetical protein